MLFAAGIVEWSLDIAKMVIAAGLTYVGTRAIEGYKLREARRDTKEARRLAKEQAAEAREQAEKNKKDFQEQMDGLRNIMSQLSSELAARKGRSQEDAAQEEESVLELGLTDTLTFHEEVRVEIIRATPIPSKTGVYVLKVTAPLVDSPRFVHFSWTPDSFRVRDYIGGRLLYSLGANPHPEAGFELVPSSMDRDAIWASAVEHLPTVAELYHAAPDFGWWRQKLSEIGQGDETIRAGQRSEWTKDRIIETLDRRQRRATYGAIAGLVGGTAFGVMNKRPKSTMNSWVVAATTRKGKPDPETGEVVDSRRGWPTGYADDEIHPECLRQIHERLEDFIAEPVSLMGWLVDERA